ncbi:hypothetical protein HYV73_04515 [Candidatus Uhrbacteria bacterium]|nr:hypothetical protein [Candidatus Uhrbacteria bacterium]
MQRKIGGGTFWRAVAAMMGGVVGVGVFGLPYAFLQSGWVVGTILLVAIGFAMYLMQLMVAELCEHTPGEHRIVGFIQRYLGPWAGYAAVVLFALSAWGAMSAYIQVGGVFWQTLFSPFVGGSAVAYQLLVWGAAAALIFQGLRFATRFEPAVVGAFILLFVLFIIRAAASFSAGRLPVTDWTAWQVPYGVVLFAVSGLAVVPEMYAILGAQKRKRLPVALAVGAALILFLYFAFAVSVLGATGSHTTPIAFAGLSTLFSPWFIFVGSAIGGLATFSIFWMVGLELQNTLRIDYKISRRVAWIYTVVPPLLFVFRSSSGFIQTLTFVGGILIALFSVLLIWAHLRMRDTGTCRVYGCSRIPAWVSYLLMAVLLVGAVIELRPYLAGLL